MLAEADTFSQYSDGITNYQGKKLIDSAIEHSSVLTSDLACFEAHRNLLIKRPAWTPTFEALLERIEEVPSTVFDLPVSLAEKDAPLYCAAIHARCNFFVTGDRRDFGHLFDRAVCDVTIITPLGLAERLAARIKKKSQE